MCEICHLSTRHHSIRINRVFTEDIIIVYQIKVRHISIFSHSFSDTIVKSIDGYFESFCYCDGIVRTKTIVSDSLDHFLTTCITDISCISLICHIAKTITSLTSKNCITCFENNFHHFSTIYLTIYSKATIWISFDDLSILKISDTVCILVSFKIGELLCIGSIISSYKQDTSYTSSI